MRFSRLVPFAAALCLAVSATNAQVPVLKYVVFPAPPFMIGAENETGEITGIDVDIVKELARYSGAKVEFIRAPWARCLELMREGKADIISSCYKRPEREEFMRFFSMPYLDSLPVAFYSLKDNPFEIKKYEDLYAVEEIGVLRGAGYFKRFDDDKALRKYDVATQDKLFPMLLARRFPFMAGYVQTESWFIAQNGLTGKVRRSPYVYSEPVEVYFAVSKKSIHLSNLSQWNILLVEMKKNRTLDKIIKSYIPE